MLVRRSPFSGRLGCARRAHPVRAPVLCCSQSGTSQAPSRQSLEARIKEAIKEEDFYTAASLKKTLDELLTADPLYVLGLELDQAVKEERYQDAARLQQQLKQLEMQMGASSSDRGRGTLSTSSNTLTAPGIRVKVQSFFRPAESAPHLGHYFFAYRVMIINESQEVVQLRSRHWVITDGNGERGEVKGPGVVGEQPILLPGKSHEYTSGCPLKTTEGSMEGSYEFVVLDQEDGEWKKPFKVTIGKFLLLVKDTTQV